MNYAPIGVSTYIRLEHLKKTIAALQENTLANESELFVFSDAARPGDEEKVNRLRDYLHRIDGFKQVHVIERKTNDRVLNNRGGLAFLLEQYESCIFLEEDVVTAPLFLKFINDGLNIYQERQDIFAICGYTPPIKLNNYTNDIYLSPSFFAWGFGIWKDRYQKIRMKIDDFDSFAKNKQKNREFCKGGEDLMRLLQREAYGQIDALDVKIFYTQFLEKSYTVAPKISLTNNIGHDGTGIHCGITTRFEALINRDEKKLNLDLTIQPDQKVIRKLYYFRSGLPENLLMRLFHKCRVFINVILNSGLVVLKKYTAK